jgi:hypothetical protein
LVCSFVGCKGSQFLDNYQANTENPAECIFIAPVRQEKARNKAESFVLSAFFVTFAENLV